MISKNTIKKIVRVTLLVLTLLNLALSAVGLSPIDLDSQTLEEFITAGSTIAMALWCCWKNCSVTKPHLDADKIAEAIKQGANIIIEYRAGSERARDNDEIEHELLEPDEEVES